MKKIILLIIIILVIGGAITWKALEKTNSPKAAPTAEAIFSCDGGKTIKASFYKGEIVPVNPGEPPVPTGSIELELSDGRNLKLSQTISASGARYANSDESFIFWNKGDTALVLENNIEKNYTNCTTKLLD